ncbi:GNAT family N-acetyltransferase [Labrys neptuniae]
MPEITIDLTTETPDDGPVIDKLHERAFGPGRFARTAFRLREGVPPHPELSFVARIGSMIVGSIRLTPIRIGETPALLLGPLTVEPAFRSRGIGLTLMQASLAQAAAIGHRLVILVGDEPYYSRVGFKRIASGRVALPGPVDPLRLLVKELAEGAFEGVAGTARGG